MNTNLDNGDVEKALAEYRLLIESGEGKSEKAISLRKKIESSLGANHEELQLTDIMLQLY